MQSIPSNPKVSVCIPTYNRVDHVVKAIESVLEQTYENYELLIVDNCSTDATEEVVSRYLSDSRVKFHKNSTNIGMVGNWNKCLMLAKGDYIKYVFSDDVIHPTCLQKMVDAMESYPEVNLVAVRHDRATSNKALKLFDRLFQLRVGKWNGEKLIQRLLLTHNVIGSCSAVMMRSNKLSDIGVFEPIVMLDWDMYMRFAMMGSFYQIDECLYCIGMENDSLSDSISNSSLRWKEVYELKKKYFDLSPNSWKTRLYKSAGISLSSFFLLMNVVSSSKRSPVDKTIFDLIFQNDRNIATRVLAIIIRKLYCNDSAEENINIGKWFQK